VRLQAGATSRIGGVGAIVRLAPSLPTESAVVLSDANVAMSVGLSANAPPPQMTIEQQDDQVFVSMQGSKVMDPFDRVAELDRLIAALETGRNYLQAKIEYKHDLAEWEKKIAEKEAELDKDFKKAKKDREKEQADAKEKSKEFKDKPYKEDKKPTPPRFDEDKEVLARVASGELPLVIEAHRAVELRNLLDGTQKFERLRLIIAGGTDAMSVVDDLKKRHIPVIVWPAPMGEARADEYADHDLGLGAQLEEAGVEVLIGSGAAPGATRDLPLLAALAVGHGLDRESALEALTMRAATPSSPSAPSRRARA
jgi:imidazolonepropionase-like amidohydrolase